MAKSLRYTIDIQGTEEEAKEMGQLTAEIDNLKRSLKELKEAEKEQGALTAAQSRERAKLATQLKGTQNAYRDMEAQVLKNNDALRKNSGFVAGVKKGMEQALGTVAKLTAAYFAIQKALEAVNKINQDAIRIYNEDRKAAIVFGDTLGYVTAQANKNANAIGLTVREYKSASAATQDLLVPLGLSRGRAAEFSTELTNLSGALSLWDTKQRSSAEISEILTKALLGEAEQAKSLGILIDQSSPAFNNRIKQMMETEGISKEQAKAMDILEQITQKTTDAQNNFANSSENMGLQQQQANAALRESYELFVTALTPALTKLTSVTATYLRGVAELITTGSVLTQDQRKEIDEMSKSSEEYARKLIAHAEAQGHSSEAIRDNILMLAKKKEAQAEDEELSGRAQKTLIAQAEALRAVAEEYGINTGLIGTETVETQSNADAHEKTTKQIEAEVKAREKLRQELEAYEDELAMSMRKEFTQSSNQSAGQAFQGTGDIELEGMEGVDAFYDEKEARIDEHFEYKLDKAIEAGEKEKKLEEDRAKEIAQIRQDLTQQAFDSAQQISNAYFANEEMKSNTRLDTERRNLEALRENDLITQQEYAQRAKKLEQKELRERKQRQTTQAAINTALAITNALATVQPFLPAGVAAAAVAAASGATQIALIQSQSFAKGGFTGKGYGSKDETGHRQAGIVHADEYVVPKNVLETSMGSAMVNSLEAMRVGKNLDKAMIEEGFFMRQKVGMLQDEHGRVIDPGIIFAVQDQTKAVVKSQGRIEQAIIRQKSSYL